MAKGRRRAVVALGGAAYALLAAFGSMAERMMREDPLAPGNPLCALGVAAALFPAACALLFFALRTGERRAARAVPPPAERPFRVRRAFLFILVCYLPAYALFFPGSFRYDTPFQLKQVFTGEYSTHHPLLHTLALGGLVRLGAALGSANLGAALYSALQCLLMAGCFAGACASVARACGPRAARGCALCFALYPLHMLYAVNATKDVPFAGLFTLTLALSLEAARLGLNRRSALRLALCGALAAMLRNNAAYAFAAWLPFLLFSRKTRPVAAAAAASLALALSGNALLARATDAAPGDLCETLSWPIQQLARARLTRGDDLSAEERETIDALMPGEAWRKYDPTISDPVKFEFDTAALLSDPARCARVYLSVGQKCPEAYFDALLLHTYSALYPYREYRVSGYYMQLGVGEDYYDGWWQGKRIESAFPRLVSALGWRFGAKGAMQTPLGYLFNIGAFFWAALYLLLREAYEGRGARLAAGLLPALLWASFLPGPVMAGRYAYALACALPLLAARERS